LIIAVYERRENRREKWLHFTGIAITEAGGRETLLTILWSRSKADNRPKKKSSPYWKALGSSSIGSKSLGVGREGSSGQPRPRMT